MAAGEQKSQHIFEPRVGSRTSDAGIVPLIHDRAELVQWVDYLTVVYTIVSMNTKTVINIKADKQVKKQAQHIAERLGVPLSTIINSFLKQLIRTEEVTFSVVPQMTLELEATLAAIEADRQAKKNISGPFTASEAIKHLAAL